MEGDTLSDFIDDVCGESRLRALRTTSETASSVSRSSEAERRQAAQDIRSSEDVVIELLRNARDAGASRIFLATQKTGNARRSPSSTTVRAFPLPSTSASLNRASPRSSIARIWTSGACTGAAWPFTPSP